MLTIETKIDPVRVGNDGVVGLPLESNQVTVSADLDSTRVVISYKDIRLTLIADELERAIANARNHA